MRSYTTREAKNRIGEVVNRAREAPVALKRFRRVAAVVISPGDFAEYQALKEICNSGLVIAAIDKALENFAAGDSLRGRGIFRALAPYWRKAGIESAPRLQTSPERV